MFKKSLGIVYEKNWEEALNQLRTLIDSKDDTEEEIVGSKDDSIETVQYEASKWLKSESPAKVTSKVLFLGESKATKNWKNVIPLVFSKYGVNIGWKGKHAIIYISKSFETGMEYLEFSKELKDLNVSENVQDSILETIDEMDKWREYDDIIKKAFMKRINFLPRNGKLVAKLRKDAKRQQMHYAVFQFYYLCLEKFMNN